MIVAAPAALAALAKKGGRGKCQYCGQYENNVSYHEAHECPEHKRPWVKSPSGGMIQGAPPWLIKRREALRNRPPPTLEEVRTQMKASAEWVAKYGFECVEKIKDADYIR